MTNSISLYSLSFREARTYLWAAGFIVANMVLPHVFHLLPQGGIIFAPLSLVIMAGGFKLGWRVALLAAVVSPLANHLLLGTPVWDMLPLMTSKLVIIAIVSGLMAQRFKSAHLPVIISTVLICLVLGGIAGVIFTGDSSSAITDITLGWPGLLLMTFGTWLVANKL